MTRSDRELVDDALAHLAILREHLSARGLDDQTVADVVSLRLAATIESLAQCSDELRSRLFGDDWPLMWATRNRIAHGYAFIDFSIIQRTVEHDVPILESALNGELDR